MVALLGARDYKVLRPGGLKDNTMLRSPSELEQNHATVRQRGLRTFYSIKEPRSCHSTKLGDKSSGLLG